MFWLWKHWLTPSEQRRWRLAKAAKRSLCYNYLTEMIKDMFMEDDPWLPERRSCPHKGMHWSGEVFPRPGPDWHREYRIYPVSRMSPSPSLHQAESDPGHVLGCVCMDARCKPNPPESDPGPIELSRLP